MASDTPPPPQQPHPPQPPPPGASREQWHEWRRQQRDYMRGQWGGGPGWYGPWGFWQWSGRGWFWPAALVVVGVWLLLNNLGLLGWIHADIFWPVVLILLGIVLLVQRGSWWR